MGYKEGTLQGVSLTDCDACRQKALRYLREYGGSLRHSVLLRYMHIDADTMRRVIDTLMQSEMVAAAQLENGALQYSLT